MSRLEVYVSSSIAPAGVENDIVLAIIFGFEGKENLV